MKLNRKIISSAVALLATASAGLLTAQTTHAQSVTLHQTYDKTVLPYIRQKGKFTSANKTIKVKNYKYYGKPTLTAGSKFVYANSTTMYTINGDDYFYLGDGGYIKAQNASVQPQKKLFILNQNSYVYDKNGKRLKTFRGGRAYFTTNSKVKYTGSEEFYRKPYVYYRIGNNTYVNSGQISKVNGKGVLFVSQNSYVYNSKGQHQKRLIEAGELVPYTGKVVNKSNQYFYTEYKDRQPNFYSIKNYKIKGNYYFRIGKNQYIKANNINAINGETLYTKQPIKVKIITDTYAYNKDLTQIDKMYRKGQTVTADQMITTGMGDFQASYFRVKGTSKDPVYINTGLYEEDADSPYVWSGDQGPTLAKQYLFPESYNDLIYTVASFKGNNVAFYNVNGEKTNYKTDGDQLAVNQKIYLWNTKENKAELYYHVQNSLVYKTGAEDDRHDTAISNLYVKADDVAISGQKLTTLNTASEAEADSKLATNSEKAELTQAISDAASVKDSIKYRLDNWVDRSLYDQAVENAQTIAQDKNATKMAVKEALWQVDFAKKNLKGAKVKVKDINNLTAIEAAQVLNVIRQAYYSGKNYPMVSVYQKWAHKPGYYPAEGWKGNDKTRYYLIPSGGAKKKLLNFSDFATEK
ncbi:SLAP domain-containing protein [Lactobacillus intestinalis]|uniref:S-layer protein n=1 Tax=Lactobacillus intestinalis DSM 6629 TaxID=1423761 RepID=A0ABR5PQQ0_9LACO|nr:SLAP domain-containing protein [Lactobacillus intestinalis]KRM33729.1 S-layer protein [Lactobacillus intestinalis DSM 6629]UTW40812.1 SLAP domain-containing protein [Lactobacillus intestinalis]